MSVLPLFDCGQHEEELPDELLFLLEEDDQPDACCTMTQEQCDQIMRDQG